METKDTIHGKKSIVNTVTSGPLHAITGSTMNPNYTLLHARTAEVSPSTTFAMLSKSRVSGRSL